MGEGEEEKEGGREGKGGSRDRGSVTMNESIWDKREGEKKSNNNNTQQKTEKAHTRFSIQRKRKRKRRQHTENKLCTICFTYIFTSTR